MYELLIKLLFYYIALVKVEAGFFFVLITSLHTSNIFVANSSLLSERIHYFPF